MDRPAQLTGATWDFALKQGQTSIAFQVVRSLLFNATKEAPG